MALHHTHPYSIIVKYYIKNMKEKTNQLGTCATCTVTRLENQERVQNNACNNNSTCICTPTSCFDEGTYCQVYSMLYNIVEVCLTMPVSNV